MAFNPGTTVPGYDIIEGGGNPYSAVDASPFLQAAINKIAALGSVMPVYTSQPLTLKTQITNPTQVPIINLAPMTWAGPDASAIVWGSPSNLQAPTLIETVLWLVGPGANVSTHAGIEITDCYQGNFSVKGSGFRSLVAIIPTSTSTGVAYTHFRIPYSANCLSAIFAWLPQAATGAIFNANPINIQRCGADISSTDCISMIRLRTDNGQGMNGNHLTYGSAELINTGSGNVSVVYGDPNSLTSVIANSNDFNFRVENGSTNRNLLGGVGLLRNNVAISFGWNGDATPTNYLFPAADAAGRGTNTAAQNFCVLVQNNFSFADMFAWNSPPVLAGEFGRANVTGYTSGSFRIQRPARGIIRQASGDVWLNEYTGGTLSSDRISWVPSNRAMGMLFDVRACNFDILRKLWIDAELVSGTDGAFMALPFDVSFNPLRTAGDCSLTLVPGIWFASSAALSLSNNTTVISYGGGTAVAYIYVGFVGGTNPALVRKFRVMAPLLAGVKLVTDPTVYAATGGSASPWPFIDTSNPVSLAVPDTDTSAIGRQILALLPVAGSPYLWVIDTSGVARASANL